VADTDFSTLIVGVSDILAKFADEAEPVSVGCRVSGARGPRR
jgi:hypothetical protein